MRSLAAVLLCVCALASAQQKEKRLILKSGDYQVADQWSVKGDRVHYHSTERNEWEDIPTALIDWAATNKFNAAPADKSDAMKQADKEYMEAVAEDEAAHPQVAPGVRLPEQGGVWMLDTFHDKPQLAELVQSDSNLNKHTGKNLLRAVVNPIPTGSKMSIELPGRRARVEAHVPQPAIYVNIDEGVEANGPAPLPPDQRWRIVRATLGKDRRVVSNVKLSLLGKASESPDVVPAKVELVNAQWVKVTPTRPLEPGQYALVEMLNGKQINMDVWDFGVNPAGPENPATRSDKKVDPLDNGYSRLDSGIEDPNEAPKKKPKKQ